MKHIFFLSCIIAIFLQVTTIQATAMEKHEIDALILLGPPLSGKGTLASKLSKEMGLTHLATGDLFREHMKNSTPLGKKAKGYIDAGDLVPDSLVMEMVFEKIDSLPDVKKYLLDGFPRTIEQAKELEKGLSEKANVTVLLMLADDNTIVERASKRMFCPACNASYSQIIAPQMYGICDVCGATLIQRPDDQPEVVRDRLRVYHKQTEPLVAYYKEKGLDLSIDALQSPDEVLQEALEVLG